MLRLKTYIEIGNLGERVAQKDRLMIGLERNRCCKIAAQDISRADLRLVAMDGPEVV
jgi:hypothetical protein